MYGLLFRVGDLSFLDFSEFEGLSLDHLRTDFGGTAELRAAVDRAGLRKALRGAPVASWLLARLARLTWDNCSPEKYLQREDDMGGYLLELLIAKGAEPVARLTVDAGSELVELGGDAVSEEMAKEVVSRFIAALVEEPLAVERCRFYVCGAELGGYENDYGWDGDDFLGAHNAR